MPVQAGGLYRLMGWCRQKGKRLAGKHNDYLVFHLAFYDANGKGVGGPDAADGRMDISDRDTPEWRLFDKLLRVPPRATTVRVVAQFHRYKPGNTPEFWLDALHVQRWAPPAPPAKAPYYVYLGKTLGVNGEELRDAHATGGTSHQVRVGVNRAGGVISGPIITEQAPGIYRVFYRVKVADNRTPEPVMAPYVAAGGLWDSHSYVVRRLTGRQFAAPNRYQEFAVDIIRPPMAGMQYLLNWYAKTDVAVDTIRVVQTRLFSDRELIQCYHLDELRARPAPTPTGPGKVLVLHGLHARHWRIDEAVRSAGLAGCEVSYYRQYQGYGTSEPPFPQDADALRRYAAVVLAGADAESLGGIFGRKALADYVRGGGGLVVLGGLCTYGAGKFRHTLVEEMLPVILAGPFDLKRLGGGKPISSTPAGRDMTWSAKAVCVWQHRLQARPDATVAATTSAGPILVFGNYGKGSVAAFLGTVLGDPAANMRCYWRLKSWPRTLAAIVNRVTRR